MAAGLAAAVWQVDADLWGHLRFGLDIVRDREIASVDPYSFTSDVPWVNHEWLSEVIMALAFLAGGTSGLWLLKVILVAAALSAVLIRTGLPEDAASWGLLAAGVVLMFPVTITLRPQLWTVLFLAVVTTTTHLAVRKLLLTWPIIFAAWANLHGGWIVGLGVVAAWIIGTAIDDRDWPRVRALIGVWLLCAFATLVNPYGPGLWIFVRDTVGLSRDDISEWQPVWVHGRLLWIMIVGVVVLLSIRARPGFAAALPVVMMLGGSALVGRLGGLAVVVALGLLPPQAVRRRTTRFAPGVWAVAVVGGILPAVFVGATRVQCAPIGGWYAPDVAVAGAFLDPAVEGRLVLPFAWGQFAIWHFAPRLKVSIDGRRETVYSPRTIAEQHGMTSGTRILAPFIEAHRPEYVWAPRPEGQAIAKHLAENGYREDGRSARSILLSRADLPPLRPRPMSSCFP